MTFHQIAHQAVNGELSPDELARWQTYAREQLRRTEWAGPAIERANGLIAGAFGKKEDGR